MSRAIARSSGARTLRLLEQQEHIDENHCPITPLNWSYKHNGAVIFQNYTKRGYPYDVVISWVQKSVRRGKEADALFCAAQICEMEGIFLSNLINRLIVFVSEDIGCADNELPAVAHKWLMRIKNLRGHSTEERKDNDSIDEVREAVLSMVLTLTRAKKCRLVDNLIHYCDELMRNPKLKKKEPFSAFKKAFEKGNVKKAVLYAMATARQSVKIRNSVFEPTLIAGKNDPAFFIFDFLLLVVSKPAVERQLNALITIYSSKKELLHVVHSVLLVMGVGDNDSGETQRYQVEEWVYSQKKWEDILSERRSIPNYAFDCHTKLGGSVLGRGKLYFWEVGCKLSNRKCSKFCSKFYSRLLEHSRAKENEDFVQARPREYQQRIVRAGQLTMEKGSYDKPSSFHLNMTCGSGKTLTCYWLARKFNASRVAVFVPSLFLLRSFYDVWRNQCIADGLSVTAVIIGSIRRPKRVRDDFVPMLARTENEFRRAIAIAEDNDEYEKQNAERDLYGGGKKHMTVVFSTYQSADKISDGFNVDLAILDECHLNMSSGLKTSELVSRKATVYSSATPKKSDLEKASSEDKADFSYGDAVAQGCVVPVALYEEFIFTESKKSAVKKALCEFRDFMQENGSTHMLFFTRSVTHSNFLKECMGGEVITSSIPQWQRNAILSDFREDGGILFSTRLLSTGIDIPECNCVVVCRNVSSKSLVSQIMGRVMRPMRGKKKGRVVLLNIHTEKAAADHMDIIHKMARNNSRKFIKAIDAEKCYPLRERIRIEKNVNVLANKFFCKDIANIIEEYY